MRVLHFLHDVLLLKYQFAYQFCLGAEQACDFDLSLVVCCQNFVFEACLPVHFAEAYPIVELVLEASYRQLVEVQILCGAFYAEVVLVVFRVQQVFEVELVVELVVAPEVELGAFPEVELVVVLVAALDPGPALVCCFGSHCSADFVELVPAV